MKKKILILDDNNMVLGLLSIRLEREFELTLTKTINATIDSLKTQTLPDLIITDLTLEDGNGLELIKELKSNPKYSQIPIMVLSGNDQSESRIECLKVGAADYVIKPFHPEELKIRIDHILEKKVQEIAKKSVEPTFPKPQMSFRKRVFDISLSFFALLILSPIFLIVGALIKIDSKGPVLYLSKRVGGGYKVFDLYKFRTMKTNADKEIKNMDALNMYKKEVSINTDGQKKELIYDGGWMSEQNLKSQKENGSAFMKFQNDPRITRLGTLLRNTSIDELPQLLNILKGDMSIVGNRPLPLYEAEKLTKDESAARFLAPAGLTGLWQVTKRGKTGVSEKERMELDNTYAFNHNWLFDIKLILKTFPAVFQSKKM